MQIRKWLDLEDCQRFSSCVIRVILAAASWVSSVLVQWNAFDVFRIAGSQKCGECWTLAMAWMATKPASAPNHCGSGIVGGALGSKPNTRRSSVVPMKKDTEKGSLYTSAVGLGTGARAGSTSAIVSLKKKPAQQQHPKGKEAGLLGRKQPQQHSPALSAHTGSGVTEASPGVDAMETINITVSSGLKINEKPDHYVDKSAKSEIGRNEPFVPDRTGMVSQDWMTKVENKVATLESAAMAQKKLCDATETHVTDTHRKLEELDNRFRCNNNLRVLGIAEDLEGSDTRKYIVELLKAAFSDLPN
ncbi:hypothetical protein NDU88_002992 [Pleurodeles waltl]|uniref:Uncharacterized protein n=1 Tax=Pleurodeles waltl TaxID=8319 RepID=A0AAV7LLQ2_PLEWA|nr:hypothetical protein NDU88_002992 [Pleurodeles waltl]